MEMEGVKGTKSRGVDSFWSLVSLRPRNFFPPFKSATDLSPSAGPSEDLPPCCIAQSCAVFSRQSALLTGFSANAHAVKWFSLFDTTRPKCPTAEWDTERRPGRQDGWRRGREAGVRICWQTHKYKGYVNDLAVGCLRTWSFVVHFIASRCCADYVSDSTQRIAHSIGRSHEGVLKTGIYFQEQWIECCLTPLSSQKMF